MVEHGTAVFEDAPPLNPAGFGLYDAATPRDWQGPLRWLEGGLKLRPYNCDEGFGSWPAGFCEDPGQLRKAAARADESALDAFLPLIVWAADECGTGGVTEEQALARARNTLALRERQLVESALATRLLADAGTAATAPDFLTALGMIEEAIGGPEAGFQGVIHLPRRWAAQASQYRWGNQSGPVYTSPLGHKYAFGGGYADVLENTIVATGPVYLWRSEITPESSAEPDSRNGRQVTDWRHNRVFALVERAVLVAYEQCFTYAVEIQS